MDPFTPGNQIVWFFIIMHRFPFFFYFFLVVVPFLLFVSVYGGERLWILLVVGFY